MDQSAVFQLTVVNHWDSRCAARAGLTVRLDAWSGGALRSASSPVRQPLAIPRARGLARAADRPPATLDGAPTWSLDLSDGVEQASFALLIEGPGGEGASWIEIDGSGFSQRKDNAGRGPVEQIFRTSQCGIRGRVDCQRSYGQPTVWRYILSTGCCLTGGRDGVSDSTVPREYTGRPVATSLLRSEITLPSHDGSRLHVLGGEPALAWSAAPPSAVLR